MDSNSLEYGLWPAIYWFSCLHERLFSRRARKTPKMKGEPENLRVFTQPRRLTFVKTIIPGLT
jgi:hypothetical protein